MGKRCFSGRFKKVCAGQESIKLSKILKCLLLSIFLSAGLSACGGESGQAVSMEDVLEKPYGVSTMQEEQGVLSPAQIAVGENSIWVVALEKYGTLYQVDLEAGTKEAVAWERNDGEYLIAAAEASGALYAKIHSREEGTIQIRKRSNESGDSFHMFAEVEVQEEEWSSRESRFFVDSNENFYLCSQNKVTRFLPQQKEGFDYAINGKVCYLEENERGELECMTLSAKGITQYCLGEKEAEERWILEGSYRQVCAIDSSDESILCLAVDEMLLFLDRDTGGALAKFDLMQTGIPSASLYAGVYDADAETVWLYGNYGEDRDSYLIGYLLAEQEEGAVKQRTELIYGTTYLKSSMEERIAAFNKENEDYYITAKVYGDGDEWDSRALGMTKMMADMVSGNGPDLIDMRFITAETSYTDFAGKGFLEDLTGYLEESGYSEDLFWNVLDAYRIDGKLYMITPHFWLSGIVISPEYEQNLTEWNIDTYFELIEQNHGEKNVYFNTSRETALTTALNGMSDEFINWDKKQADFENEKFISLLKLCKEYGEGPYPYSEGAVVEKLNEQTLFNAVVLSNIGGYVSYVRRFGREYPIYGNPVSGGEEYQIQGMDDACAISAGSKQKEGAWEFIETLLEPSYQQKKEYGGFSGMPIRISCWEYEAEAEKEICYTVGTETVLEYGEDIMSIGFSDQENVYITDNEIAIIRDILNQGTFAASLLKISILDAVKEEAAAYFAGDKTAEEVAHIIQSRVQIMLEE